MATFSPKQDIPGQKKMEVSRCGSLQDGDLSTQVVESAHFKVRTVASSSTFFLWNLKKMDLDIMPFHSKKASTV